MKKRNLIIRIIAIVMCALLVLGVVTVAIYALAAGPEAAVPSPDTGSNDKVLIFALIAVIALVAAVVCAVATSKSGKNKKDDGQDGESK
ncbi:MAG: hypothetical protein IJM02_01610 [Clostridia bacterium]|jgi:type VI protein secretion system component VasK|nr:hypothetical protein [Clostridia bacterium]